MLPNGISHPIGRAALARYPGPRTCVGRGDVPPSDTRQRAEPDGAFPGLFFLFIAR